MREVRGLLQADASPTKLQKLYAKALRVHQSSRPGGAGFRRWFEWTVTASVFCLRRARRMQFPERRIDDWFWTARWQFEILMRWNEWESLVWCRRSVARGDIVVDVGAHIGYYSRLLSELAGTRGRVIAVEPFIENQKVLQRNLRGYANVRVMPFAAADRESTSALYVSPGSSNHSLTPGYTEARAIVPTRTRALDDVLEEQGIAIIQFIKIDVEGGEPAVLRGLTKTIARSPRLRMLIECNPAALRCGGVNPPELIRQIRDYGFDVYKIEPDASLSPIASDPGPELMNLLCWKRRNPPS